MSYYEKNRLRARTRNTEPTLTDQAGARDTDINVIVKTFTRTGMVPSGQGKPLVGLDFTQLPQDLRGFIETANSLNQIKNRLPAELRSMDIAELMALTPEQLRNKLTPPTPKEAPSNTQTGTTPGS